MDKPMSEEQPKADEIRAGAEPLEHTPAAEETPQVMAEAHDKTVVLGVEIPYPVYTVVFAVLGVLTLLEVLVGTSGDSFFRIPLLLVIAVIKAGLVVLYYMHLKSDSRVYRFALTLPLIVALGAIFYLLLVPPVAYGS